MEKRRKKLDDFNKNYIYNDIKKNKEIVIYFFCYKFSKNNIKFKIIKFIKNNLIYIK